MKNQLSLDHLNDRAKHVVTLSKKQGAEHADVALHVSKGFTVSACDGDVENVQHEHDVSVDITVYNDQRVGSTSTNDMSDIALEEAVKKACYIATKTAKDPFSGLAEKADLAFDYPTIALCSAWDIDPGDAIKLAISVEKNARDYDKRITKAEGIYVSSHMGAYVYANTLGFIGGYHTSRHSLTGVLIAADSKTNDMQQAYDFTQARRSDDLLSVEALAEKIAKKTVARLNPRTLSTRSCAVLLTSEVAKNFVGNILSAISGRRQYRRATFLVDQLGQSILPDFISIIESPHVDFGIGSAPFDAEGVATVDREIISNGVLNNYLLSSYSARQLKTKTTGHAGGVHNASFVAKETISREKMLQQMGTGLLVTDIIGPGDNVVTGDYSMGVFGYWVERGEIQYPVADVTIAANMKDMMRTIVAVGDDLDTRHSVKVPSLLIESMRVSGEW